jgi:hypothetical protein
LRKGSDSPFQTEKIDGRLFEWNVGMLECWIGGLVDWWIGELVLTCAAPIIHYSIIP